MTPMTWLLIASAVGLVAYELWAAITRKAPTISQLVWWAPVGIRVALAFFAGCLMGHLFL